MSPLTIALPLVLAAPMLAQSLAGFVDIHSHQDPDSMPRSIDAIDLARASQRKGVRAIVMKNHYEPTASLAYLVRKVVPGIEIYGGIALNRAVGGINAAAVDRMAATKGGWGRVVWMPTFDAENQVRTSKENRPFVSVSKGGALLPEVGEVLAVIARRKLTLATGHSTPAEDLMLIRAAKAAGVQGIIVTHAMLGPVHMSIDQMKEAAGLGAYLEFVGNAVIGQTKVFEFSQYVSAIKAAGVDRCILSSDLGQAGNPLHPDGVEEIMKGLIKAGLTPAELRLMMVVNPARALGLDTK